MKIVSRFLQAKECLTSSLNTEKSETTKAFLKDVEARIGDIENIRVDTQGVITNDVYYSNLCSNMGIKVGLSKVSSSYAHNIHII